MLVDVKRERERETMKTKRAQQREKDRNIFKFNSKTGRD